MEKRSFIDRLLSPLGLTLLAIVALLPGIWSLPLVDRDEPRFSHATVEMIDRGEWAIPYFNDEYRFDKPPLTYWWMRANFKVFGINETGARMHSVQSSWIISLLLFFFARRLGLDRRMAFLAGLGWLTALQVLIHSRLAVADMPLILFLVLTMTTLHQILSREVKRRDYALLTLWLGLGFLAKGPLAYAIPEVALLFTFGILAWKIRKTAAGDDERRADLQAQRAALWRSQKVFLVALVPSLLLVAIWGIPALIDTKGAYFGIGIGKHVVERGTGAMNKRFFLPGLYYVLIIIPFLLPWTAQLPATLKKSLRASTLDAHFLLGWFVAPFLVFSFYATQLPHYILPGYPAFFLLLALSYRQSVELGRFGKVVRAIALGLPALLGLILLILGFMQVTRGREALDLSFMVILIGGVFLSLALIGAAALRPEKIARVAMASAFAAFVVFFSLATEIGRRAHLTLRLRETVGIPKGTLAAAGYNEPSLVWYFDDFTDKERRGVWSFRSLEELTPEEDALTIAVKRRWRIDDDSIWPLLSLKESVPLADDNTEKLVELFGSERIEGAQVVSGWSPATSSWIEAIVLRPR